MVHLILILATLSAVHCLASCQCIYNDMKSVSQQPSQQAPQQPSQQTFRQASQQPSQQTFRQASQQPTQQSSQQQPTQSTFRQASQQPKSRNQTIGISDWGPYEEIIAERKEFPLKHIDNVAFRGNPLKDYRLTLRDMNVFIRDSYDEMIQKIGLNLYPLIIAHDGESGFPGVGSSYTLFLADGTSRRIVPTPPEYEVYKNLAHLPLGMFAIVSPYFNTPTSPGWQEKLRKFQKIVQNNLEAARQSGWSDQAVPCKSTPVTIKDQIAMLWYTDQYINSCLEKKSVDPKDYENYTAKYTGYVVKALECASEMQVDAALPQLEAWKKELGPAKWRDLYVVIPVKSPSARRNTREQLFESLMDPDRLKTHIIKIENVNDFEGLRKQLGRIVGDRSWAHFLFGSPKGKKDLADSLFTRKDVGGENNVGIYHQPIP